MDAIEPRPVVLIVEDDPRSQDGLQAAFRRRGWLTRTASTTAEALALLASGFVPEGMILDLMLPDGNGNAVFQRVRDLGLKTRVAIVTGTTLPSLLMKAEALKPDLLLIKPIGPEALANLLDEWTR